MPDLSFFQKAWNAVLKTGDCRGYYSERPCLAQTCRDGDVYCGTHELLSGGGSAQNRGWMAEFESSWKAVIKKHGVIAILNGDP